MSRNSWCDLDMEKLYPVALVSFLANGGSYLYNFPAWIESHETGGVDYDAFKRYLQENSPIHMAMEVRITVNYHEDSTTTNKYHKSWVAHYKLSLYLMLLVFSFIQIMFIIK